MVTENLAIKEETNKKKRMTGFRAFKAQVPIQWSQSLYITLVRGLPGTRKLHRRTLEAMGLRRCHRTVLHSNTSSIRGMIQQVLFMFSFNSNPSHSSLKR